MYNVFRRLSTLYSQIFSNHLWIIERLFSFYIPWYDENERKIRKVVLRMALLSDELLIDSYKQAVRLRLDSHFIALLFREIKRRCL